MLVNQYSAIIPEGKEDADGYVLLEHGQTYSLTMRNNHSTRCNVRVEVDGKHQGTWRIPAKDAISIERPGHDDGKFTFYRLGSREGNLVGLSKEDSLGLVQVTFTPEKKRPSILDEPGLPKCYLESRSSSKERSVTKGGGFSAGGTGLSGLSSQSFGNAQKMELDESKSTTISLRLVASKIDEPRPLTNCSNPVPPPVH